MADTTIVADAADSLSDSSYILVAPGPTGTFKKAALSVLKAFLEAATAGVTSFNSRAGAVMPAAGDYSKSDVGLANVDNTSDTAKPVSTAQAAALALKAPLASPTFTGTVTGITKAMVGLGNVDNTADPDKPISSAAAAALAAKAPLASPALTGTPTAPTAALGTNTTQIATMAAVKAAIDALVAGAPGALDTLNEIAAQLANDESAVSALTTVVGTKVDKVTGRGLSTNDYSNTDAAKVAAAITNAADTYTSTPTVTGIVTLTQTEYNAIATPNANTLYVIV